MNFTSRLRRSHASTQWQAAAPRETLQHDQSVGRISTMVVVAAFLWAVASSAPAAVHYVDVSGPSPVPPYATWATAATNIQDAIDVAMENDEVVVTNGVYETGGRAIYESMTNRVAVTKPVSVRSVNGPDVTIIRGYQVPDTITGESAIRCVYLTNRAALAGFTLTSGATHASGALSGVMGGGVWCESVSAVISNCVLTGNAASWQGGGTYGGTLQNCTLTTNGGGAAVSSLLNQCTLRGNSGAAAVLQSTLNSCLLAQNSGRGADGCTLNECTLMENLGGGATDSTLTNCALTGNFAEYGGGALRSTLTDSRLTNNVATGEPGLGNGGGGAFGCTLINCTLVDNVSATWGGGAYGGTLTNCTLQGNHAPTDGGGAIYATLNNSLLVLNLAGHDGGGAFSCKLYTCTLSNNSATNAGGGACLGTLSNCTLTANSAGASGGGAYLGTLTNCTLTGNWAGMNGGAAGESTLFRCLLTSNSTPLYGGGTSGGQLYRCTLRSNQAGGGGGAFQSALNNCLVTGNSAPENGGGTWLGWLTNCTVTGNSAGAVGGAYQGILNNCILYHNAGSNHSSATLSYCCTIPLPLSGRGNFTNAPLFVDEAGGGGRLQSTSPCINSGYNAFVPAGLDLDNRPRVVGGTVDVGAYEFQTPTSLLSYAWLQQYLLSTDGSADFVDADGDGLNNWEEWRCLTDPTNAQSVLRLLSTSFTNSGVLVSWQGVSGVNYFLERATNWTAPLVFAPVATAVPGRNGTTSFIDRSMTGASRLFYRVGVKN